MTGDKTRKLIEDWWHRHWKEYFLDRNTKIGKENARKAWLDRLLAIKI